MFIQGPLLVIWDLLVTLSSGQEPGRALAICVGESPGSPSSVSGGRTDTELPTAPSRGQKQKCRSWGCHFALVPAPPTPTPAMPAECVLARGEGESQTLWARKAILLQNGEHVGFLKLHPSLYFSTKTTKALVDGGSLRANNPERWLLSSPPFHRGGKLRPGDVPRLR